MDPNSPKSDDQKKAGDEPLSSLESEKPVFETTTTASEPISPTGPDVSTSPTPEPQSQEPAGLKPLQTPTPTPFPGPSPTPTQEPSTHGESQVVKPMSSLSDRPGGFRTFVIFAVIIIVIIYGAVAYLYFQNRNMRQGADVTQEEVQQVATPTPPFSPDQIKIVNGSVVREKPGEEPQILIDKEDYESTGITGFSRVLVSPDNTHLCFESMPPAPEPALYISRVDGSEVSEVSPNRQDCVWVSDSSKIYYLNTADLTSPVNIYTYVLETKAEENLTADSAEEAVVRRFEIVGLSQDATKLMCSFVDVDDEQAGGQCEIDLETNQLTLL